MAIKQIHWKMSLKNISGISLKLFIPLLFLQAWKTENLNVEPLRNRKGS